MCLVDIQNLYWGKGRTGYDQAALSKNNIFVASMFSYIILHICNICLSKTYKCDVTVLAIVNQNGIKKHPLN